MIVGRNETTTSRDTITVVPRRHGVVGRLPGRVLVHRARPLAVAGGDAAAQQARQRHRPHPQVGPRQAVDRAEVAEGLAAVEGLDASSRGQGLRLPRRARRAARPGRGRADPVAGDPAGLGGRLDLPAAAAGTSRPSAPTPPGAGSTSTTPTGGASATRPSSSGSRRRGQAARGPAPVATDLALEGMPRGARPRPRSGCSTSATSGSAATPTPTTTARSASPPSSAATCGGGRRHRLQLRRQVGDRAHHRDRRRRRRIAAARPDAAPPAASERLLAYQEAAAGPTSTPPPSTPTCASCSAAT